MLDSVQQSYLVGKSTFYEILRGQRDLAEAKNAEIAASADWRSAAISLDEARGVTLEVNQVSMGEAKSGKIARSDKH